LSIVLVVMLIAFPSLFLSLYYFATGHWDFVGPVNGENWSLKYNWIKLFEIFAPPSRRPVDSTSACLVLPFPLSVSRGVSSFGEVTESINPARENSGGPKRWS